jgi:hypothetical protein
MWLISYKNKQKCVLKRGQLKDWKNSKKGGDVA